MNKYIFLSLLLVSCSQQTKEQKHETTDMVCDSIETEKHNYAISENLTLESEVPMPIFSLDSLKTYSYTKNGGKYVYIKDHEERMYFSTQIAELTPAILEEEIYPDYNDAKVRYFVFNDNAIYKENRNRIFVGVLLSQYEQMKVREYFYTLTKDSVTIVPLMGTPNDFTNGGFRHIKRESYDEFGNKTVIVDDRFGNDSTITIEPLKRNRFGRKNKKEWQTLQFDD